MMRILKQKPNTWVHSYQKDRRLPSCLNTSWENCWENHWKRLLAEGDAALQKTRPALAESFAHTVFINTTNAHQPGASGCCTGEAAGGSSDPRHEGSPACLQDLLDTAGLGAVIAVSVFITLVGLTCYAHRVDWTCQKLFIHQNQGNSCLWSGKTLIE